MLTKPMNKLPYCMVKFIGSLHNILSETIYLHTTITILYLPTFTIFQPTQLQKTKTTTQQQQGIGYVLSEGEIEEWSFRWGPSKITFIV